MRPYAALLAVGGILVGVAAVIGGRPAAAGGAVALGVQLWAVALLRPVMRAPNPRFMGRWLGGMAVRALALAVVVTAVVLRRHAFPPLATTFGFLGVLLPLLFLETRFLR